MSDLLLRNRLAVDLQAQVQDQTAVLVAQRWANLHDATRQQGIIEGLNIALHLLEERFKNLHTIA